MGSAGISIRLSGENNRLAVCSIERNVAAAGDRSTKGQLFICTRQLMIGIDDEIVVTRCQQIDARQHVLQTKTRSAVIGERHRPIRLSNIVAFL